MGLRERQRRLGADVHCMQGIEGTILELSELFHNSYNLLSDHFILLIFKCIILLLIELFSMLMH